MIKDSIIGEPIQESMSVHSPEDQSTNSLPPEHTLLACHLSRLSADNQGTWVSQARHRAWVTFERANVSPKVMSTTVIPKNNASSIGSIPIMMPVVWAGSIAHVPEAMARVSAVER